MGIDAKFICYEEPAFYAMIDIIVGYVKEKHGVKEKRWVRLAEAEKLLGVGKTKLQQMRNEGQITFNQHGGIIWVDKNSIDDFMAANADRAIKDMTWKPKTK